MTRASRLARSWLAAGTLGFVAVPWYALQDSVLGSAWVRDYAGEPNASALIQVIAYDREWLAPVAALLVAGFASTAMSARRFRAGTMTAVGALGPVAVPSTS